MRNKYYVYILQNPRKPLKYNTDKYGLKYEPFYVGKGTGNRAESHYQNSGSFGSLHNMKLLDELLKLKSYGKKPIISKVFTTFEEGKAYEKEEEIIISNNRTCMYILIISACTSYMLNHTYIGYTIHAYIAYPINAYVGIYIHIYIYITSMHIFMRVSNAILMHTLAAILLTYNNTMLHAYMFYILFIIYWILY